MRDLSAVAELFVIVCSPEIERSGHILFYGVNLVLLKAVRVPQSHYIYDVCCSTAVSSGTDFITALHCMQRGLSDERPSVRPSVCQTREL